MSEHIATCPVLAQWSSLPLAFVSRSVGVVSDTPSSSPALRRTVRGFLECRANSPLGMGVHHELAQDEQSRRADHTRHTLRTRQSHTRQSSASTETASFTTGLAKTGLSRRRDRVDLQWCECDTSQSQAVRESVAVRESPPVSIHAETSSDGSPETSSAERMVENIARDSHQDPVVTVGIVSREEQPALNVSWETSTKTTCTRVPGDSQPAAQVSHLPKRPITVSETLYRVEDSSQCWRHCTVSETLRFFAQSGPGT